MCRPFLSQESGSSGASSQPRLALRCPHCPRTFADMIRLQSHTFVDHTSSSSPEPHTPPPASAGRAPLQMAQRAATPATTAATTPTLFNGELLAAARMVNIHQHQTPKSGAASSSTSSSPPPPNVSLPRQFPNGSQSRESSVASSSSESEDKSAYNCDLCGTSVGSGAAFKQVRRVLNGVESRVTS